MGFLRKSNNTSNQLTINALNAARENVKLYWKGYGINNGI